MAIAYDQHRTSIGLWNLKGPKRTRIRPRIPTQEFYIDSHIASKMEKNRQHKAD